ALQDGGPLGPRLAPGDGPSGHRAPPIHVALTRRQWQIRAVATGHGRARRGADVGRDGRPTRIPTRVGSHKFQKGGLAVVRRAFGTFGTPSRGPAWRSSRHGPRRHEEGARLPGGHGGGWDVPGKWLPLRSQKSQKVVFRHPRGAFGTFGTPARAAAGLLGPRSRWRRGGGP